MTGELARAFEVLGVEPGCGLPEARSAYRRLARESHPDLGGDSELFARIHDAWERVRPALSDRPGRETGDRAEPEHFEPRRSSVADPGRVTGDRAEPEHFEPRRTSVADPGGRPWTGANVGEAGTLYSAWRAYAEPSVRPRSRPRRVSRPEAVHSRFADVLNRELRRFATSGV